MNITWLVGFTIMAAFTIIGCLDGGEAYMFIDTPSLQIVLGGTFGAMIASTPLPMLKNFGKLLKIAVMPPKYDPYKTIDDLVDYATTARSKGLLALEESANSAEDPFMKQALMLIVDANDPDKAREMLENAIDNTSERHSQNGAIFTLGIAVGPAFGMIGTLVGLIIMLNNMAGDPGGLATAMAVAIITTFYGSLLANVVFTPLDNALKSAHSDEELCKTIIVEGVMSIAAGANPRFIREKLEFMLPRSAIEKRNGKK